MAPKNAEIGHQRVGVNESQMSSCTGRSVTLNVGASDYTISSQSQNEV